MTVSLASIAKLRNAGLSAEQMAAVMDVLICELTPLEVSRARTTARQAKYKSVNGNVRMTLSEQRDSNVTLAGERVLDKTLPSLTTETVRKEDPPIVPPALVSKPLPSRRGTRLPDDFEPDETCHALAEKLQLSRHEAQQALDEYRDFWRGVPGAKGCKTDWNATFRNQLRRVASMKGNRRGQTANGHQQNTIAGGFAIIDAAIDRQIAEAQARERDGSENPQAVSRLRQSAA